MAILRNNHHESDILRVALDDVAHRHSQLQCVYMNASDQIANFPITHAPSMLAYRNERVIKQWTRLDSLAGMNTNADIVEWVLHDNGIIDECTLDTDPFLSLSSSQPFHKSASQSARHISSSRSSKHNRNDTDSDDSD